MSLPSYPSAAVRKSFSPSQLAATKKSIAAALLTTAALPPTKRNTPATRNFITTYAKDTARATLEALIWDTPIPRDEELIRKRTLVLAEALARGLDLQTLVDLAIIYASTNATQARAILAAGLESSPPEVRSELLPAFVALLSSSAGLYALRKTGYCIFSFLRVCPKNVLRTFTHSKEFILSLAEAYDTGLTTLAHSYGGLRVVSDSRESDEWERIWVSTKVSLIDTFHIILRALLEDIASSAGPSLAVEVDQTFDIVFSLLALPSHSSPSQGQGQTPFLDRTLLADYQQSYDLSRTLASTLREVQEEDARVELLESQLQSLSSPDKEPGALKIILRSSGIPPGVDNLGKGLTSTSTRTKQAADAKGKAAAPPPPTAAEEDPEMDLKVTQVLDILPDHPPAYIRALLAHPSYALNPEQVVAALLDGTAPPSDELILQSAPPPEPEEDEIARYVRRNVHDEDDMDLARVRRGKRNEDESAFLRDRTYIEQMKAEILRIAEQVSDDDDEDEDAALTPAASGTGKGKTKQHQLDDGDLDLDPDVHLKVAGDGEDSGSSDVDSEEEEEEEVLTPQTICERAYLRDPALFDRDAQTKRGKARVELRLQTGWTDEQLEGWRIMLERDPKGRDKLLQKHEFVGRQNPIIYPQGGAGPSSQRGRSGHGGRGGGARGRGRGAHRGRGGGGGGGGEDGTARERAWKDKNKASRGNHNRKRGHDKKLARAGGPA